MGQIVHSNTRLVRLAFVLRWCAVIPAALLVQIVFSLLLVQVINRLESGAISAVVVVVFGCLSLALAASVGAIIAPVRRAVAALLAGAAILAVQILSLSSMKKGDSNQEVASWVALASGAAAVALISYFWSRLERKTGPEGIEITSVKL